MFEQAFNALRVLSRLFSEGIALSSKSRITLFLLLETGVIVTQAATVASLSLVVSIAEKDQISVLGETYSLITVFVWLSLGLLAFMTCGAYSKIWAARVRRGMARKLHKYLAEKTMQVLPFLDRIDAPREVPDLQGISYHLTRDPVQSGNAFELILRLYQPICLMLVASVAVFVVEPVVSLIATLLLLLAIPPLYVVWKSVHLGAHDFYQEKVKAMSSYVISEARNRSEYTGAELFDETPLVTDDPLYEEYLDGYDVIQLAGERIGFVISLFRSWIFFVGILVVLWLVYEGARSPELLVIYAGALLYFFNGVSGAIGALSGIAHLYPQLRRLFDFYDAFVGSSVIDSADDPEEYKPNSTLSLEVASFEGDSVQQVVSTGIPFVVLTGLNFDKRTLSNLKRILSTDSEMFPMAILDERMLSNSEVLMLMCTNLGTDPDLVSLQRHMAEIVEDFDADEFRRWLFKEEVGSDQTNRKYTQPLLVSIAAMLPYRSFVFRTSMVDEIGSFEASVKKLLNNKYVLLSAVDIGQRFSCFEIFLFNGLELKKIEYQEFVSHKLAIKDYLLAQDGAGSLTTDASLLS